jgi:hypothetical protein
LRFRSTWRALLLVAIASLPSTSAFGQAVDDSTRNAARSLASQGKEAFDKADYERACDLFHRAYTLVPAPTIALYEARALAKLRLLVEAEEAYMRAARTGLDAESPEPFRKAVHDAEDDLRALRARMPKVTIVTSGAGASDPQLSMTLDGRALTGALVGVELPIDPGQHTLRAVVPGGEPTALAFSVVEKQRQKVELAVAAGGEQAAVAPKPLAVAVPVAPKKTSPELEQRPSPWQSRAGLIVGGVGVVGVATGVITGLMAGSRYSTAKRECPEHACVEGGAGWDAVQSFRTLRTVSTVGYIVGGVGLAAGTTLLLTAPSQPSSAARAGSVNVWLSVGSVGVAGVF